MKQFFFVVIVMLVMSCQQPKQHITEVKNVNTDSLKEVLMQTDLAFSDLSKAKGRNASFLEYMDDHVTMLRPNGMPLVGKDTMRKRFSIIPDTSYRLTWKPLYADVSASGDLGYTYGRWLLVTTKNDSSEGTYCSIWKQQPSGDWKFVLDTGNEG
jgi:ketosteroid isomerase-like protein